MQQPGWRMESIQPFFSVPHGRHHTTSTKATKGLTSHRNGLILYLEPKWLTPYFGSIWGPIKKCSRSRCQLGYPNTRSCAFDNLACKHQKQCHVSVDQRCRPHWCPWWRGLINKLFVTLDWILVGQWGSLIWRIIINPYMTETYNQYNSLHKPNQPGFLSPVGPQIVVPC